MKKIFSFAIVLCAAAMVSCGGNTTKKVSEADAAEAAKTEASACAGCTQKCDSTDNCCGEKNEGCCEKAEGCCEKAEGCDKADSAKCCDQAKAESACCNK